MSNRDGVRADKKKRDKYVVGKLCPKCNKGHFQSMYKPKGHIKCPVCGCCNY